MLGKVYCGIAALLGLLGLLGCIGLAAGAIESKGDLAGFGLLALFPLWISTIIVANVMGRNVARRDFWKAALRGIPGWAQALFYVLLALSLCSTMLTAQKEPNLGLFFSTFYGSIFVVHLSAARVRPRTLT